MDPGSRITGYGLIKESDRKIEYHENPNSALKLGHARGVAMVAAASHRVKVSEYSAREIKQMIVGYGAAEKAQVSHMVVHLLALNKAPQKRRCRRIGYSDLP